HYAARHHASRVAASEQGSSSWKDANAMVSGHGFTGVASTYGNESGHQTASGQRFNENAMTCAHRSLPFGTKLRISHGGRSVVVTVNDRGPFVRGRVLDLSTGAARAIGLSGLGQVTAEVVGCRAASAFFPDSLEGTASRKGANQCCAPKETRRRQ